MIAIANQNRNSNPHGWVDRIPKGTPSRGLYFFQLCGGERDKESTSVVRRSIGDRLNSETINTQPPSPGDCELPSAPNESEIEIAAPELDGPQHAPSPNHGAQQECEWKRGGRYVDFVSEMEPATTLALTEEAFSWKRPASAACAVTPSMGPGGGTGRWKYA